MVGTLDILEQGGLERSGAGAGANRIRFGSGGSGLERAQVFLAQWAFEPHRHDTYAIGVTTAGVQTFRYRGAGRVCLPGQVHVLHPDELHDGAAGTRGGFGYRILYLAPETIADARPGRPLPFVAEPVHDAKATSSSFARLLADVLATFDDPISDLRGAEIATAVADELAHLAGQGRSHPVTVDLRAVRLVREYLREHASEQTPVPVLERIAGIDRFTIARHFRRAFGTSPDRYRTLRRLALARAAIEAGQPLATAAAGAGFADQSHLTRQFKRAYGFSPGRWRTLTAPSDRSG